MPPPLTLGRHLILELFDCPVALLQVPADAERILLQAAQVMGATVVSHHFHAFSPYGVSGVVIIKESHLTIHTWPEHGYAAIDIFTCGAIDIEAGRRVLEQAFQAEHCLCRVLERGPVRGIEERGTRQEV